MHKFTKNILAAEERGFQYYPARVNAMQPLGDTTMEDFILLHQNNYMSDIFDQIAKAEADGDAKLKASLKQNNLRVFTPCVIIGEGKDGKKWKDYAHIQCFSGTVVLDFDHLPSVETAIDFKKYIFETYGFVYSAWLSPSRHGIKALVSIPLVSSVAEFKAYFWGLEQYFQKYSHIKGKPWIDGSGQNPTLSLFQSFDPDILYNEYFYRWTEKGQKENSYNYDMVSTQQPNINISGKDRETVLKSIKTMFQNIDQTTGGHPQLIKKCITIGGLVSGGYLTQEEALQIVDWNIENHHYLCKGIKGYKQDARFGISEGIKRPIIL